MTRLLKIVKWRLISIHSIAKPTVVSGFFLLFPQTFPIFINFISMIFTLKISLAFFSLGQYREATFAYRRAKQLDPENESISQSLAIAEKKLELLEKANPEPRPHALAEQSPPGASQHGHSHGGQKCNHNHGAASSHGHSHDAPQPASHGHSHAPGQPCNHAPDFSSLMNNPALREMLQNYQAGAGGAPGNVPPALGSMLNNPEMINTAAAMLNQPGMGNMLQNPAVRQMYVLFLLMSKCEPPNR